MVVHYSAEVFSGYQFVLDLGSSSFKKKQCLRSLITSNGGQISYILTKKSNFLVVCKEHSQANGNFKCRKAKSLGIPVVSEEYVEVCVEKKKLLDPDEFVVAGESKLKSFSKGKITSSLPLKKKAAVKDFDVSRAERYKYESGGCPDFPSDYNICKFVFLEKENKTAIQEILSLEIHVASCAQNQDQDQDVPNHVFRVMNTRKSPSLAASVCYVYPVKTAQESLQCYEALAKGAVQEGMKQVNDMSKVDAMGSQKLQNLLSEMKSSAGVIHPEVVRLIETMWMDSLGKLEKVLSVKPIDVTVEQLRNATISLMKIQHALNEGKPTDALSDEFYRILPHHQKYQEPITTLKILTKKRDLCQLLKDILLVGEIAWLSPTSNTVLSQYSSLNCSIQIIDPMDKEMKCVKDLLYNEMQSKSLVINNVYRVNRSVENSVFRQDLFNIKPLFHASSPHNFVGILSRGLLLPTVVMKELGGGRTDEGTLGNGIYFSDSMKVAAKYAHVSPSRGSRLLMICDVALGNVYETKEHMPHLTTSPEGFNSVRGVGPSTGHDKTSTIFEGNEYVIYNTDQQKMKYIVEFTLNDEKRFDHSCLPQHISSINNLITEDETKENEKVDFEKSPKDTRVGLIFRSKDNTSAKLEEVHMRTKIIDLLAEVTIFQVYTNQCRSSVEAKYVFPLAEDAAVCGFEAYINDKHVVGVVKEKETAHREYKEAINTGHGAYLMDEEKPNIFTVSVGNIPPSARVVIKIIYVSELSISSGPESKILFALPGTIAPWDEMSVKLDHDVTQTSTQSVSVSNQDKTSLIISVDMPFDIMDISSPTHEIAMKMTASKACVKLKKSSSLDKKSFLLSIKMAEIHVPRIWIEKENIDEENQAAMVTFFPEFDTDMDNAYKCLILLDMSNSMQGSSLICSKALSYLLIDNLPKQCQFNVILFGSNFKEYFVCSVNASVENKEDAKKFISSHSAPMGGSDVFYLLNSILNLQSDSSNMYNVFLLSDGHLSESDKVLQLAQKISSASQSSTRIFSFGIGDAPNSHLLQSLSVITGGHYEYFDPGTKSRWKQQLQSQVEKSGQPVLTNIYIDWCNYETHNETECTEMEDKPMQVPEKVKCLFNGSRLVAYSFLPGCRKATLHATVCGKEFSTVVSANDLCITTGDTLHRLAAKAIFKEYETGLLGDSNLVHHMKQSDRKASIISLSIKYSVVTKYTSFVAVEKREKGEEKCLGLRCGPTVSELVKVAFTDIIPEIEWMNEEFTQEDRIDALLKEASQAQASSILHSRQLIDDARKIYQSLSTPNLEKDLLICAEASKVQLESDTYGWNALKRILLKSDGHLNYDFLNDVTKDDKPLLQDAVQDLVHVVWPDHCKVLLSSFSKEVRPLIVGAFTEIENVDFHFFQDPSKCDIFWNCFRCLFHIGGQSTHKSRVLEVKEAILQVKQSLLPNKTLIKQKLITFCKSHGKSTSRISPGFSFGAPRSRRNFSPYSGEPHKSDFGFSIGSTQLNSFNQESLPFQPKGFLYGSLFAAAHSTVRSPFSLLPDTEESQTLQGHPQQGVTFGFPQSSRPLFQSVPLIDSHVESDHSNIQSLASCLPDDKELQPLNQPKQQEVLFGSTHSSRPHLCSDVKASLPLQEQKQQGFLFGAARPDRHHSTSKATLNRPRAGHPPSASLHQQKQQSFPFGSAHLPLASVPFRGSLPGSAHFSVFSSAFQVVSEPLAQQQQQQQKVLSPRYQPTSPSSRNITKENVSLPNVVTDSAEDLLHDLCEQRAILDEIDELNKNCEEDLLNVLGSFNTNELTAISDEIDECNKTDSEEDDDMGWGLFDTNEGFGKSFQTNFDAEKKPQKEMLTSLKGECPDDVLWNMLHEFMETYKRSYSDIVIDFVSNMETRGFWIIPEEKPTKMSNFIFNLFSMCKDIITDSGALSLGSCMISIVFKMIITAVVIEILKMITKREQAADISGIISLSSKWLHDADGVYPFLYSRLELGPNWSVAAQSVLTDAIKRLMDHTTSCRS